MLKTLHTIGVFFVGKEKYRRFATGCRTAWEALWFRAAAKIYNKRTGKFEGVVDVTQIRLEDAEYRYEHFDYKNYKRAAKALLIAIAAYCLWSYGWVTRQESRERITDTQELVMDKVLSWEFYGIHWKTIDTVTYSPNEYRSILFYENFSSDIRKRVLEGHKFYPLKEDGSGVDFSRELEIPLWVLDQSKR